MLSPQPWCVLCFASLHYSSLVSLRLTLWLTSLLITFCIYSGLFSSCFSLQASLRAPDLCSHPARIPHFPIAARHSSSCRGARRGRRACPALLLEEAAHSHSGASTTTNSQCRWVLFVHSVPSVPSGALNESCSIRTLVHLSSFRLDSNLETASMLESDVPYMQHASDVEEEPHRYRHTADEEDPEHPAAR